MMVVAVIGFVAAAAAGTLLRWQAGRSLNASIPWGTLAVNVVGAFMVGLLVGLGSTAAAVIVTGGLGSLTTMSSLAFDADDLGRQQRWIAAMAYLGATVALGVLAAWIGLKLAG